MQNQVICNFISCHLFPQKMCVNTKFFIRSQREIMYEKNKILRLLPAFECAFYERQPRLRSRPKFSSDQTFQTKIISDQTFQSEFKSGQTFKTQVTSDQLSRPKAFWSDHLQTMVQAQCQDRCRDLKKTMIRLRYARRGYDQTQLRSKRLLSDQLHLQPLMIRLKCVRSK